MKVEHFRQIFRNIIKY